MEPEDILSNLCAALVSLERLEPAVIHLLRNRRAGEWVPVAELYRIAGAADAGIKPELAATWLPSPSNQPDYVVIVFCDDELQWNMTASYNAGRLVPPAAPQATGPAR